MKCTSKNIGDCVRSRGELIGTPLDALILFERGVKDLVLCVSSHAARVGERWHGGGQAGQDDEQLHRDVPGEELDPLQGTAGTSRRFANMIDKFF